MLIALIIYCLLIPALALTLARRFAWARAIGPVLMCCGAGIALINQPLVPWDEAARATIAQLAKLVSSATIPLAIPLLLFQSQLSNLRAHGKQSLLSFVVAVGAVTAGISASLGLFASRLDAPGDIAGMVLSVYIGGTPNLVAVQRALEASAESFGLAYAATTFASTFYLIFLMTVAKPLLARVYPPHPAPQPMRALDDEPTPSDAPTLPKLPWQRWLTWGALSVLASALCVALSAGITFLFTGTMRGEGFSLGVILTLTTLSVLGSLVRPLRQLPTHEPIGMALILVFCVSAGMMMDLRALASTGGAVLTFTAAGLTLALVIHFIAHKLLKIDVDTTLIMSVACIFGPPFIPAVAQAINNRAVLLPGMTMGFLGYAVGTYLGIALGYLMGA